MTALPLWRPSQRLPLWHCRAGEDLFGSTETRGFGMLGGSATRTLLKVLCRSLAIPHSSPLLSFRESKLSAGSDTAPNKRHLQRDAEQGSPHLLISNIVPNGTSKARMEECLQLLCPCIVLQTWGSSEQRYRSSSNGAESWNHSRTATGRSSVLYLRYRIFAFEG